MSNLCLRCGDEWESRIEGRPKNCPSCKSPRWDTAKVSASKAGRAHSRVAAALRKGELVKQPCEQCGDLKTVAHHEDYDRPLDVLWLCRAHHRQRHVAIGEPLMEGAEPNTTLYIRNLPDALVKAVRMKAIEEDKRIDELLAPFIELAINSKPINSPIVGTQRRNGPVGKKL